METTPGKADDASSVMEKAIGEAEDAFQIMKKVPGGVNQHGAKSIRPPLACQRGRNWKVTEGVNGMGASAGPESRIVSDRCGYCAPPLS